MLAELAAIDGFSFNAITHSAYIRSSLCKDGFKMPKSHTDVSNMVNSYAAQQQSKLADAFEVMVKTGTRFSLTMDEYTSLQNRRFMNINLHSESEHWNLGVFRIEGSMTSDRIIELVNRQLGAYTLNLDEHTVCATTDGASVMVKYGKLVLPEHQQCHAHALHLAVMDVLYTQVDGVPDSDDDGEEEDEENPSRR